MKIITTRWVGAQDIEAIQWDAKNGVYKVKHLIDGSNGDKRECITTFTPEEVKSVSVEDTSPPTTLELVVKDLQTVGGLQGDCNTCIAKIASAVWASAFRTALDMLNAIARA